MDSKSKEAEMLQVMLDNIENDNIWNDSGSYKLDNCPFEEVFPAMEVWHTQQSAADKERITTLEKLFDFVFNLNGMTTKEFCDTYEIELPSWKGDVTLASSEFLRLDAIKWKMVKDAAQEFYAALNK